ncbi:putative phenol 2-monooxygenase [Macrophomina phaseolina]|uniref:Phenol 2-monooxygenase n=1 Tax=Macrophomina phaseolina TaxID=35725 RepID=A0ABQ8GP80_9PEZI|nr:putative phenol 2-monooxygenase [Macrophomina phaseolina]
MHSNDIPESRTDVLIIGAGPAGLTAAYWMAQYGVNARIIDKRGTKIFNGQADGLRARTQELFDSMGIQDRVEKESKKSWELHVWNPDGKGGIKRTPGMRFTKEAYSKSRFFVGGLNQGRIERFILDAIKDAKPELEVERGIIAERLEFDEGLAANPQAYPITVTLWTLSEEEANPSPVYGSSGVRDGLFRSNLAPDDWEDLINKSKAKAGNTEVVKAKYIIGCDGAHSWTRKQLGIQMEGAATDFVWGVMDIVPISNFPDMRHSCIICNDVGTILLVARERSLMRLYIPLTAVDGEGPSGRFNRSNISLDMLKAKAQKILHPYTFGFKICDWWSAYQVGQRAASALCDPHNRIFIAGDASHTHSPKVGAGMNISIQDAYNIAWKVASVATSLSPPSLLPTYALERHPVAHTLAAFDKQWSALFAPGAGSKPDDFDATNARFEDFAQGFVLDYPASVVVDKSGEGKAEKLVPGERFWPAKVVGQADAEARWTTNVMRSDGRWRVVVLAGDVVGIEGQMQRVERLCEEVDGLRRRVAPEGKRAEEVIDVVAIHCAERGAVEIFDFPEVLRPVDEMRGVAYDKIWVDEMQELDQDCDGRAYEKWGVDRPKGAVLVMRPDQYIGWIGELEGVQGMERYFQGVLNVRN